MNVERINGSFDHYWENNRFGTLSGKEREEIESTNMTEEVALECFKRENWWSLNNHYESDYIPEWGIMSFFSTPPMFYLFDSIDGETQIVRQLEYIDPRHKSFREAQRFIFNPKTGKTKSLRMPRSDMNPYKVSHPFYETEGDYIRYSLGGYNNVFGGINFGDSFFYFRRLVPGIKKENILKRDISMVYKYGENIKGSDYLGKHNSHIWMNMVAFKSLISGKSLFEILWELGLEDRFYNGSSSTKDLDLGFLENHRESFLISRRNGVDFGNPDTLSLWVDTIKLLEKYKMDIKCPKYISKELRETHDLLVARENKKARERMRAQERAERLRKEYKALEEKERLERDEEVYLKEKERYLGWTRSDGDIEVVPVQSVSDCIEVGMELSNCCLLLGRILQKGKLTPPKDICKKSPNRACRDWDSRSSNISMSWKEKHRLPRPQ